METEESITEALRQEGWTRQFTANEPRLSEAVELYKESGFEVRLEQLPPVRKLSEGDVFRPDGECRQCFEGDEDKYRIIFTRPKEDGTDNVEDELF